MIFEYNGSALVAMVGKNCFAIASDRRLGVQLQTIATDFQRIYEIHEKLFIGPLRPRHRRSDFVTIFLILIDFACCQYVCAHVCMVPEAGVSAQAVSASRREEYEARNLFQPGFCHSLRERVVSYMFGPYFCQPVIARLGDDNKPFICTMDSIGAKELAKDFVVAGTASESLYGACEAMFKPDMGGEPEIMGQKKLQTSRCIYLRIPSSIEHGKHGPGMEAEELFETISQALLSSVDRDCLSGWGGHVYVVTPTEVTERILKGRMD
ncbi:proteasome beta subunit C1 [Actinidia rufa]|uniref:Proteasome beta subunit C1 n=1 Tax=Actinidia rufa TaxID=165716 RepID=A0A7J0DQ88_9ERIC|nr:proteasome beta subunit C1 [Actinidia rufa]